MPAPTGKFDLDPALRAYATPAQWDKMRALAEHGSVRAAAAALGINPSAVWSAKAAVERNAAIRGYAPDHDMKQPVPDGFRLKGTSTLYRSDTGEPIIQWVKSERDGEQQAAMLQAAIEAMNSEIRPAKPVKSPQATNADLLAVYPVGDHHMGALSWEEETGANYDLSISESLLLGAVDHLMGALPGCDHALIPILGDFLHYDSFRPETPTNKNLLDSDTRFPKLVRVAIRCIRYMAEAALKRHAHVTLIFEVGNHDPSTIIVLMEAFAALYVDEPRITVNTSPRFYHYYEFGKCLIGTHHGHQAKMDQLPMIMATDQHEAWGRTKFRYWYTGHIHHRKSASTIPQAQDFNGCTVESFRVLAPPDAWADQKGYRPIRDMKGLLLHREHGEVARHTVNPDMLI